MSCSVPPSGRLTPFYIFSDAKTAELRELGRQRVSTNEIIEYWRNLSEADRKPYEEKAAQACAAYLEECNQREVQRLAEGGDEEEGEDENDDDNEDGEGKDEEGNDESKPDKAQLPLSRIKRIISLGQESKNSHLYSRESVFAITKAVEFFLERCVWESARVTARSGRKTLQFQDVVTSMRQHHRPEAMQFFVEEFQPKPEPPEPKSKPMKRKADAGSKAKAAGGPKQPKQQKTAAAQGSPDPAPAPAPAPASAAKKAAKNTLYIHPVSGNAVRPCLLRGSGMGLRASAVL